jgi:hypothetical protein
MCHGSSGAYCQLSFTVSMAAVPSVSCGAAGAMGTVYIGVPVSLSFQGESIRSFIWGKCRAPSSCAHWKQDLPIKE